MGDSNDTPGPDEEDSREAVLRALEEADVPALTIGMVEERTDYSSRTAYNRLEELAEEGEVETAKIGNGSAYWIPDDPVDGGQTRTATYHQMSAKRIGSVALGVGTVAAVLAQLSPSLVYALALVVGALAGVVLIAWGAAPLLAPDDEPPTAADHLTEGSDA